ncbi:16S rRNA (guanine(966)-N(2))-methyltransferase RsmD [Streptomyces griseoviridis]|nr:16S rRNA (guanine(966)-N(2))-methyltransferase RsmD [Streptomyces griseoviridis]
MSGRAGGWGLSGWSAGVSASVRRARRGVRRAGGGVGRWGGGGGLGRPPSRVRAVVEAAASVRRAGTWSPAKRWVFAEQDGGRRPLRRSLTARRPEASPPGPRASGGPTARSAPAPGSEGAPSPGPQRLCRARSAPAPGSGGAPSPGPQRLCRARSAPAPGSGGAPSPGPQRIRRARSAPAPGPKAPPRRAHSASARPAAPPRRGPEAPSPGPQRIRRPTAPPPGPRRRPRPAQGGAPVAPKTPSPSPPGPSRPRCPPAPPPSARGRPLPPARRPRSPARLGLSSRPRTRTSDMTRVIAGVAGGRRLAVPPGTGTRPTSDRAREGLFSTWESLLGGPLAGERVLDLYAGSGAIGLEALSRGAGHTLLVEADARAVRVIKENVRGIGLPGAEVRAGKAEQVVRTGPPARPYDIVFLDPPYAVSDDDLREILLTLRTGGWLAAEALVTVERSTRGGDFGWPDGFAPLRARRYGEGTFWYGHAASTCDAAR